MPAPRGKTSTTRLPKLLLDQLQLDGRYKSDRRKIPGRKERRRNERMERKHARIPSIGFSHIRKRPLSDDEQDSDSAVEDDEDIHQPSPAKKGKPETRSVSKTTKSESTEKGQPTKSILKKPKSVDEESDERYIRKAIKEKLAGDDAEIAVLEKKLKIKSKKLPKSFEEDGLDFLLEGLDEFGGPAMPRGVKKKRERKLEQESEPESDISEDLNEDGMGADGVSDKEDDDHEEDDDDEEDEDDSEEASDGGEEFMGFESGAEGGKNKHDANKGPELDIYGRPKNVPAMAVGKYIPPSLRNVAAGEDEEVVRLRRQTQGQINRLSEANMLGIVSEVEKLYINNPRNSVTSTITDTLLATICDRSSHLDTFMVLHAGFIAALYKIIGTEFGAHVVQSIVGMFDKHYGKGDEEGKQCTNIVSLLSELYNFQVIGSSLMFDFVRLFLKDITEINTELLLKVVRNSGSQLRADDPTALKDLFVMMQPSIAKIGEANLSVRTKFMIETMTNLKNNKLKAAFANSQVLLDATNRMKKTLGSLNVRQLRATEPLRVTLDDIRNVETKGKWWLVGASWRDSLVGQEKQVKESARSKHDASSIGDTDTFGGTIDLLQLAKDQRMNTDVRRAIFITIMSSEDFQDACDRLRKLPLKKKQQTEIPRVLLHCCGSEAAYNPYYALLARRLCGQHQMRKAFEFCLWDFFGSMGEDGGDGEGGVLDDDEEEIPLRKIVSLAKLYGTLVAEGALRLNILKTLDVPTIQKPTRTFLKVFLMTVLLKSQAQYQAGERSEKAVLDIFLKVDDIPAITRGLLYFFKKHMKNTDIAGGEAENELLRWGIRVASDALKTAVAQEMAA